MTFRAAVAVVGLLTVTVLLPPHAAVAADGVRGIVRDESGTPLPKVCVSLADAVTKKALVVTKTGLKGAWAVLNIPSRGVNISFRDCGNRGFVTRFFGASQVPSLARVAFRGSRADTVMTKQPGSVSGVVTNERGEAVEACVSVADAVPPHAHVGAAVTDADGRWEVPGLMPDGHLVSYRDCGGTNYARMQSATVVRPGDKLTATLEHTLKSWLDDSSDVTAAPADVLFLGDSVTEGYDARNREDWWVDLVRVGLQTTPGGVGYVPAAGNEMAPPPFPSPWTTGGGTFTSQGLARRSLILDAEGDVATATVTADRVWVHYVAQPGGGLLDVYVDGQAAGRIDTASTAYDASTRWDSGPLTAGTHIVELRSAPGDAGEYLPSIVQGVMVFAGDSASGVRIWESGHAGYTALHLVSDASWLSGLRAVEPELVVIAFGGNDQRYFTPAQFESHLRQLVAAVRDNSPSPPAIALVSEIRPAWVASTTWSSYAASQQRVATDLGLAFTDLDRLATAAGESASTLTTDGVHPNLAGQRFIADHVQALLTTGSSI